MQNLSQTRQVSKVDIGNEYNYRPVFPAHVGLEKPIATFFDTGSPKNIMSEKVYQMYFSHLSLNPAVDCRITDVQGNNIRIVGQIDFPFKLGRISLKEKVLVVRDIQLGFAHLLIGYPTMAREGISINAPREQLVIRRGHKISRIPLCKLTGRTPTREHSSLRSILKKDPTEGRYSVYSTSSQQINTHLESNQETYLKLDRELRLKPGESAWIEYSKSNF